MQTEECAGVEGRDVVLLDHVSGCPVDVVAERLLLFIGVRTVGGDGMEEGEESEDGEGEAGERRHCCFRPLNC